MKKKQKGPFEGYKLHVSQSVYDNMLDEARRGNPNISGNDYIDHLSKVHDLTHMMNDMLKDAEDVVSDYEENPSNQSGSVYELREDSPYFDERMKGDKWKRVVYSNALHDEEFQEHIKEIKKTNKKLGKKKKSS